MEGVNRRADRANAATPQAARLADLDRKRHNVNRAVAGLEAALANAPPERRPGLEAKRAAFLAERLRIEAEKDELTRSSLAQQAVILATSDVRRAWEAIGLDREERHLAELQLHRGRGSGRAGADFERDAIALAQRYIRPELGADGLHVLRGVRLGAAGVEFDVAIVHRTGGSDEPVEVLAVVEVKRNINDLARGFLRRQIDLAWLTREAGAYDAAEHRTGQFPRGALRPPVGPLARRSSLPVRPGLVPPLRPRPRERLLPGPPVPGDAGRAGVGRVRSGASPDRARIATDEDWDPANEAYLNRLFDWCRSLAGPVETPDVVRLYTETAERARRLLVSE